MMACEPLSVLILSTCLIAFWPCVLPLCFAVPILPYPMYFAKNETHEVSDSNDDKNKANNEKKRKPEPPPVKAEPVKEVKEIKEEMKEVEEPPDKIGPSKGTLVPDKKPRRTKARFDGSHDTLFSVESEEECCTIINCEDKNVGRDLRDIDLECDICGRYKANIYYDSDDYCDTETEIDEIIVIPKKKPKMVNKKTKTNNKVSGDRCTCNNRKFGRAT